MALILSEPYFAGKAYHIGFRNRTAGRSGMDLEANARNDWVTGRVSGIMDTM